MQQTIPINNTMNSNFSFYFIITKIMRHEFVFKDNNKIKQIGRVLCIKYIKCILMFTFTFNTFLLNES